MVISRCCLLIVRPASRPSRWRGSRLKYTHLIKISIKSIGDSRLIQTVHLLRSQTYSLDTKKNARTNCTSYLFGRNRSPKLAHSISLPNKFKRFFVSLNNRATSFFDYGKTQKFELFDSWIIQKFQNRLISSQDCPKFQELNSFADLLGQRKSQKANLAIMVVAVLVGS